LKSIASDAILFGFRHKPTGLCYVRLLAQKILPQRECGGNGERMKISLIPDDFVKY